MKTIAKAVADGAASLLAILFALGLYVAVPALRLIRLARLRASCKGRIPVSTQFDGAVHTEGRPRVDLADHVRLGRGVFFETGPSGRIAIGAHVRINTGTLLVSYASVTVGDDVLIGEYASIRDADHGMAPGALMRLQPHNSAPIVIEKDAWIGRGAVVLKGVVIGAGAVVAANSVVTRDVPPMAVVAGSPARVIRQREAPK
jgi:acetyltransferase-like isoleucine patch superfamily enzyme